MTDERHLQDIMPFEVKKGDIAIFEAAARNKETGVVYSFVFEPIYEVREGTAYSMDGTPMIAVKGIFKTRSEDKMPERFSMPRNPDKYDRAALLKSLQEKYGPGELITGFACDGRSCMLAQKIMKK